MAATLARLGGEGERTAMPVSDPRLPKHFSTPPTVRPHDDLDVSARAEKAVVE